MDRHTGFEYVSTVLDALELGSTCNTMAEHGWEPVMTAPVIPAPKPPNDGRFPGPSPWHLHVLFRRPLVLADDSNE